MAHETGDNAHDDEAESLYSTYDSYNRAVRTWFVSFGIGGPALILTNSDLASELKEAGVVGRVAVAFLIGCALQIAIAITNKISAWYSYSDSLDSETTENKKSGKKNRRKYREKSYWRKFWLRIESQFWIDITCDLMTLCAFAFAVVELISVVVSR